MTVAGSGRAPGRKPALAALRMSLVRRSSAFSLCSRSSSNCSVVSRSSRSPRLASSWRIQLRRASVCTPSSRARCAIGRRGCSERHSRTARSCNSTGYLRGATIEAPSFGPVDQVQKPPRKWGELTTRETQIGRSCREAAGVLPCPAPSRAITLSGKSLSERADGAYEYGWWLAVWAALRWWQGAPGVAQLAATEAAPPAAVGRVARRRGGSRGIRAPPDGVPVARGQRGWPVRCRFWDVLVPPLVSWSAVLLHGVDRRLAV